MGRDAGEDRNSPRGFRIKSLVYADKPQTLDPLEDNIRHVIADIRPQMLEKVIENWTSRLDYIRASRGSPMPEIIFKINTKGIGDGPQNFEPWSSDQSYTSAAPLQISKPPQRDQTVEEKRPKGLQMDPQSRELSNLKIWLSIYNFSMNLLAFISGIRIRSHDLTAETPPRCHDYETVVNPLIPPVQLVAEGFVWVQVSAPKPVHSITPPSPYQNKPDVKMHQLIPSLEDCEVSKRGWQCHTCHVARSTMDWCDNDGVNQMDWPVQCPHLNPLENLRGQVGSPIGKRTCMSS
ncbi:hypothetical protein TNCV_1571281 [Trichonephila clavipes]|uniref:Uncharacterized protein n=1 Tax=Trichonephila clavipes TaxID=2585209 RepID=A0A8X6SKD3_TRICX|nr:hypothetical protein TNCV_1571281 [Trichonephila clavipes]